MKDEGCGLRAAQEMDPQFGPLVDALEEKLDKDLPQIRKQALHRQPPNWNAIFELWIWIQIQNSNIWPSWKFEFTLDSPRQESAWCKITTTRIMQDNNKWQNKQHNSSVCTKK